ncbi:Pollen_Ole_e_I domain-containing protein [Cephalotus follicularis]|uniref:Pollen_Ole_e_I domain-containing protein n=1 Tax=Cephalotus follicularis TaxID=3775 RepID=A0A1Q3D422_CEPFO|nr:Pollen_Ole_e_I domain-containing protein [Cephalotus follicularis]
MKFFSCDKSLPMMDKFKSLRYVSNNVGEEELIALDEPQLLNSALSSMALHKVITALLFASVLSRIELCTCQVVKGKISCLDCSASHYDLSGIKVLVKCEGVKKLGMATTEKTGSFEVELPSHTSKTATPLNCLAKLLGGPNQLYAAKKNMVSRIINAKDKQSNSYTISTALAFHTSCPSTLKEAKCGAPDEIGSSKTIDLPIPREWGLAPTSYYIPFFPIIGVP